MTNDGYSEDKQLDYLLSHSHISSLSFVYLHHVMWGSLSDVSHQTEPINNASAARAGKRRFFSKLLLNPSNNFDINGQFTDS